MTRAFATCAILLHSNLWVGFVLPSVVFAELSLDVIALSGQPSPDGNGVFHDIFGRNFDVNAAGHVSFQAVLTGTNGGFPNDIYGHFLYDGSHVTKISRQGEPLLPGEPIGVPGFSNINDAGDIALHVTASDSELYLLKGSSRSRIAREGDPQFDGEGDIVSMGVPVFNNAGQVAYRSAGSDASTNFFESTINFFDGATTSVIARNGNTVPEGDGEFGTFFAQPALNNLGHVVFYAQLKNTSAPSGDVYGLYKYDGSTLSKIVRTGQPHTDGTFRVFSEVGYSDTDQIFFTAGLNGTSAGLSNDQGVFVADASGIREVVREGDLAPDGTSRFFRFPVQMAANSAGQLALHAQLTNTASNRDEGLYLVDASTVVEIAREGDAVPGGDGEFAGFSLSQFDPNPQVNAAGQVAFLSELRNTEGAVFDGSLALFLTSPQGRIREVVRTRQWFDVDPSPAQDLRTVQAIDEWTDGNGGENGWLRHLNDNGTLVFGLRFTDGSQGLFAVTVPETTTGTLFAIGFIAHFSRMRRLSATRC